jgi:phosphoheptose isomerase
VLIFGNGGRAADAQHFACELVGRFLRERRALPAMALTADTTQVTAIANDYGFDRVDIHVNVSHELTPRVQEVHRTLIHAVCDLIERRMDSHG